MSNSEALEKLWHQRLTGAKLRLENAQIQLHELIRDYPKFSSPDGHYAYRQAVKLERLALQEYARVRRIYENLTIHGIIPNEDALAKESGAE